MIASGYGWVGGWGVKEEGCDSKLMWVGGWVLRKGRSV